MKVLPIVLTALLGLSPIMAAPPKISTFSETVVNGEIGFEGVKLTDVIIGVEPYEQEIGQDLIIDMKVMLDLQKVAGTDNLESTVDYVKLADVVRKKAKSGKYKFIDVFALSTLKEVFQTFPEVDQAFIRVQKPKAVPNAKSGGLAEVSLTRDQFVGSSNEPWFGEIGFQGLYIQTIVGDLPEERSLKQDLWVDLKVKVDLAPVNTSNEIESTVNYVEMAQMFDQIANNGQYYMFETLAVNYLKELKNRYPHIEEAQVKIKKPGTLPSYPFKNDAITQLHLVKDPNNPEVFHAKK